MATHAKSASGLIEHEVAHHFDSLEQEFDSHKLGMWLFLASEIMMFGALFVGALVFLTLYPEAFSEGSHHLDWKLGAVNTFFLLTSGLTMGLAVWAAQNGEQAKVRMNLIISVVLASGFLVVKSIEYATKFEHGTLPGKFFTAAGFTDPHRPRLLRPVLRDDRPARASRPHRHGPHDLVPDHRRQVPFHPRLLHPGGAGRPVLGPGRLDLGLPFPPPLSHRVNSMEQQYPGHVVPKSTLIATYFGLIFLTALMVGISRIDVESLHVDWISLHAIKAWSSWASPWSWASSRPCS